jgi:hypothetical protein
MGIAGMIGEVDKDGRASHMEMGSHLTTRLFIVGVAGQLLRVASWLAAYV